MPTTIELTNLLSTTSGTEGESAAAELASSTHPSVARRAGFRPKLSERPPMIGESTISAAADVDATAVSKYRPFFSPRAAIRCGAGASAVNDTLIGQLKSFMTGMQTQFGDLGQQFLPQVKTAFGEINSSLQVAFTRINGSIAAFGGGSLIEGLVSGLTKVIDLSVTLFEKYLPQSRNMFSGFGSFFDKAKKMFGDFKEGLKGLSEGAKVITDTFGPVFIKKKLETWAGRIPGRAGYPGF